ncbi:ABC transporter permease [Flavitalea sp.]|nr:ABC transporter permease [Flavitalea sp.]
MLKNYFIIAIRHLSRHKLFSLINVLCLGIGITFSMLIWNYIMQEKQVNLSLKNAENQYLIKSSWKVKDMGLPITTVAPLAKALKDEFPALVDNYYRFNPVTNVVSAGDKHFKQNISICDTSLVSMYGFKLIHGDPKQAFKNNSSAVITERLANKLFGNSDAVNKTITVTTTTSGKQDYLVSAVLANMSYNTVNQIIDKEGYDVFVPFEGNKFFGDKAYIQDWSNIFIIGMLELKPGVKPAQLAEPIRILLSRHLPDNINGLLNVELTGLADFYRKDNNGAVEQMISTLSLVAIFILLMAIINFVNISIGTSTYRLKEIGLRKVFGGKRKQLVIQYLVESLLLSFVAAMISLGLYEVVRPLFNQLLTADLDPVSQFGIVNFGWLLLFVTGLGIIAGLYPAIILSASKIIHSVHGKIDTSRGGLILRKTLLIVQFTLAIFIFISALNVSKQVSYIFNKDLGYDKEQLLIVTAFPKQWDSVGVLKMESIRDGLAQLPVVKAASISFEVPDRLPPVSTDILPAGETGQKPVVVPTIGADQYYASTFGLKIQEGSFLQNKTGTANESEIVLNDAAVKALNLESPVGSTVTMPGGFTFKVRGIVKDFNFSSFQKKIGPLAFIPSRLTRSYRYITLKLNATDISKAINDVKLKWQEFSPGSPFEYTFMDEKFRSLYESELKLKKAAQLATVLNLFIVFMGVFGIVAFTLARRTKEIAVRKVLGAEVKNIIMLFIKDYALLIIIANLIAWPLAFITTDNWLQNYSYRVQQDFIPYFTVAGVVSLATFVFITAQCFKTAMSNPVKNLRTE